MSLCVTIANSGQEIVALTNKVGSATVTIELTKKEAANLLRVLQDIKEATDTQFAYVTPIPNLEVEITLNLSVRTALTYISSGLGYFRPVVICFKFESPFNSLRYETTVTDVYDLIQQLRHALEELEKTQEKPKEAEDVARAS